MIFSHDPTHHQLVASVELEQRRRFATRHRLVRRMRRTAGFEHTG